MKTKDRIIFVCAVGLLIIVSSFLNLGCLIRLFTGFSCPGCGISRAWISILQGNFVDAFYYHPLFLTAPFVAAAILFEEKFPRKALNIFWCVIAVLFVGCYILRIVNGSDILTFDFKSGVMGRIILQIWAWLKMLLGTI